MTIENMGAAIAHWLGFQDKIGRDFMMNEDALKYPLADYLVNDGGFDIKAIDLERPHPNFASRQMDAAVLDISNIAIINHAFEFKLAKSTTRHQVEKQRIFDDLFRLHLANMVTAQKCYFVIAGKSANFQRDFRDYSDGTKTFYRKWFSFTKGQSMTFDVLAETDPDYSAIYALFVAKYSYNFVSPIATSLVLPTQITTTCEFITAYKSQFVPYMAGIWSIS